MTDIIADFHGTLYKDTNDGPLWKYVAKQAVTPSQALAHPLRAIAFARAKPEMERLVARYGRGEIEYAKIYEAFNHYVLSQLSLDFVEDAIEAYACLPETTDKLDNRVLRPILNSRGRRGILSTGSDIFIREALYDVNYAFFPIYANPVISAVEGSRFDLETLSGNKPHIIQTMFVPTGFDPRKTVYIGDNADEEPVFEYVIEHGGKVVVPFFAADDFKQHAAAKYGAVVPESEQELQRFLDSVS
ncbi:MAG: hypothetical protein HY365_00395 [Candidatus Aenigmarchaeota archaeon]|nr:hypothetical protein [Candidatus Aenigmarchaeota archaeon]